MEVTHGAMARSGPTPSFYHFKNKLNCMVENTVHNKFNSVKDKRIDRRIIKNARPNTHVSNEHSNKEKVVSGKHLEAKFASYFLRGASRLFPGISFLIPMLLSLQRVFPQPPQANGNGPI